MALTIESANGAKTPTFIGKYKFNIITNLVLNKFSFLQLMKLLHQQDL